MSKKSRSVAKSNPGWFPKGRSGNLNGRPRASRVSRGSGFEVLVKKTLSVADDRGGTREITLKEALQQRTYQDALPSMSTRCLKPKDNLIFRTCSSRSSRSVHAVSLPCVAVDAFRSHDGIGRMSKKSRSVAKSNPGWFPKGRSGNLNASPRASRVSMGSGLDALADKTLSV